MENHKPLRGANAPLFYVDVYAGSGADQCVHCKLMFSDVEKHAKYCLVGQAELDNQKDNDDSDDN